PRRCDGRRRLAAARAGHRPRHRHLLHAGWQAGVRRVLHPAVLRSRLGEPVPDRAGGLREDPCAHRPERCGEPRQLGRSAARAHGGVPRSARRRLPGRVRVGRVDRTWPHGETPLYDLERREAHVITPTRTLNHPLRARADSATSDPFLTVAVTAFILAMYVVSALPGLSRTTHLTIGLMFLGMILRSIRTPLRLRLELVIPMGGLFISYALASVLWSANQSAALVSAIGLLVDFSGAL